MIGMPIFNILNVLNVDLPTLCDYIYLNNILGKTPGQGYFPHFPIRIVMKK